MLSLISISLVVVSGDDESEKVDTVIDDYDDDEITEKMDDTKVVEETQTDTASEDAPVEESPAVDEDDTPSDEDTVDVGGGEGGNVTIGKQRGKYMNYDDYFIASAIEDSSDASYNWNGKSSNP